ncbi:hypothetical protein PG999_010569 [Apiospora kogelbergensis]|uniref:Secreted protein n=1 Tax=Apiospora kogelbergensis TaxID=1337665 RepID=A0AAW0QAI8_9PEZI
MITHTALTQLFLVWWSFEFAVDCRFLRYPRPFPESICDSLDVRVLVDCEGPKRIAGSASLIEDGGVVTHALAFIHEAPDRYAHYLASPYFVSAAAVVANKSANDVRVTRSGFGTLLVGKIVILV